MKPLQCIKNHYSGFSYLEVIIAVFVFGIVLTGIYGLYLINLRLTKEGEDRTVAVALVDERMEKIRNLPYASVGTAGGIPIGNIAQQENITRNGVPYVVRTDIRYVDDPYDGTTGGQTNNEDHYVICHHPPGNPNGQQTITVGASALDAHLAHGDTTGACGIGGNGKDPGDQYNADYKQARVEVSWPSHYHAKPVLLITYITPSGVEGGDIAGTLDFQALDAAGAGVSGATVNLTNTAISPAINFTTETNVEGRVVLPGLPQNSSSYGISVTKDGYTTEQTFPASASAAPDTDHSPMSMIKGAVTQKTFLIDHLANVVVHTQGESGAALPSMAFHIRGTKTIGQQLSAGQITGPLYKLDANKTTDNNGRIELNNMEWDSYTITLDGVASGYDIKESSLPLPLILNPGDNDDLVLTLVPHIAHSLHITVIGSDNKPVGSATILVDHNSYHGNLTTDVFGQVFFADISEDGNYTVNVNAPSFMPQTVTAAVSGTTNLVVKLAPTT